MITTIRRQFLVFSLVLLSFLTHSYGQDLQTFNQNSTVGNNTRAFNQNSSRSNNARGLNISFSPVYSTATKSSKDSMLFRGNGVGFRFGADYFFGKAGISFSSGFGSSSTDDATINNFLKRLPVPPGELIITKTRQQNMYLLLGPSINFGNTVELYAHAKGGLFINNSGLVSIQQKGSQKAVYRNESTTKSIYPGFLTGLGVQYKTKSNVWSFGIGMDYMNTRSEVNNYDARRGGGIEALKLSRNISDVVTGIIIRYNIHSTRDVASGLATGKRLLPTVNKREIAIDEPGVQSSLQKKHISNVKYEDIRVTREAGSGMATGRRTYQPGQPVYGNRTREESSGENCGTVIQRTTNPEGITEEITFACPDDAANYNTKMNINGGMPNRISMNVTVPKQTQGATFGEKVNQGLHAAGSALSQGASFCIISGTLTWGSSSERMGILTNKTLMAGTTSITGSSPRGGSTNMNSQTSSTRTITQGSFGTIVLLSARETGSGRAKGQREYQPIFAEGQGDVCNPCLVSAKMSGAQSNPLFSDKGMSGVNPFYEESKRTVGSEDKDCDGVAGADIFLIDAGNGDIIAKTKTERCGDFFFASIPEGDYVVKVSGSFISKKGYDIYLKSKSDLHGGVTMADDWEAQLRINTSRGNNDMEQKSGISTSRSNIRNKTITIIEADLDGDGEFESTKVLAGLYDGTTKDITAMSRMSMAASVKKVTVRGWDPEKKQAITGSANSVKEYTISIDNDNSVLLTSQYDNGTKEDARVMASVTHHPNVIQFVIPLGDPDSNETYADMKIQTKSNIKKDRIAGGDTEDNKIRSPRSDIKILRMATGDMDGDGTPEMSVAAPFVPGGSVITAAMRRPGEPIPGIDIKLGKNPGTQSLQTTTSNANGEFEFTKLEAGDYTFIIEQKIFLEDETFVSLGGNNTKVQDYNSSRSNKTSGIVAADPDNVDVTDKAARKGWDGTVKGKIISSGDKRTIFLETNEPVTFRWTPLVPKPKEPVTYRLKVWQLMQGQNGIQARQANQPIVERTITNAGEVTVAGIFTGPCKPPYLCDFIWNVQAINKDGNPEGKAEEGSFIAEQAQKKIQNINAVPNNRTELKSILIEADLDGDGEYETDITNKISDETVLDENGSINTPQQKAGISTSRSNIRNRNSIQSKGDKLFIGYGTAEINKKQVPVKIVYKVVEKATSGLKDTLKTQV